MRAVVLLVVAAACGRVGFDPAGERLPTDDSLFSADARSDISPPVIITDANANASCPSIAWTGTEWGVAFLDYRNGSKAEIYFTRATSDGAKVGADVRISNDAGASECPRIVWTGANYFIVFADDRFGNFEIIGQSVAADGTINSAPSRITSGNPSSRDPDVTWTGSNFNLVWTDTSGANSHIVHTTLSPTGAPSGAEQIISGNGDYLGHPAIVQTPEGAAIAWNDDSVGAHVALHGETRFSFIDNNSPAPRYNVTLGAASFQPGGLAAVRPAMAWTGAILGILWNEPTDQQINSNDRIVFRQVNLVDGSASPPIAFTFDAIHMQAAATPQSFGICFTGANFMPLSVAGMQTDAIAPLGGVSPAIASDRTRYAIVMRSAPFNSNTLAIRLITPM